MKYAGPTSDPSSRFTEREAWDSAKAACMAEARRRGTIYPIPPGKVHGRAPADLDTNPVYGTHYLTSPRETAVAGEFLLEVTEQMEALPAGTERVDGADVEVTRAGTVRDAGTFAADPEPVTR